MKQLLTMLMLGITSAFCQIDNSDIIVDSLDNVSLKFIGEGKEVRFNNLTVQEVEEAKKEAIIYIDSKVNLPENRMKLKYDFEKYTKQYTGFIDEKGTEFIYINGFCNKVENIEDLKRKLLIIFDGGNCFFQMKINKKTGECVDFRINGYA